MQSGREHRQRMNTGRYGRRDRGKVMSPMNEGASIAIALASVETRWATSNRVAARPGERTRNIRMSVSVWCEGPGSVPPGGRILWRPRGHTERGKHVQIQRQACIGDASTLRRGQKPQYRVNVVAWRMLCQVGHENTAATIACCTNVMPAARWWH